MKREQFCEDMRGHHANSNQQIIILLHEQQKCKSAMDGKVYRKHHADSSQRTSNIYCTNCHCQLALVSSMESVSYDDTTLTVAIEIVLFTTFKQTARWLAPSVSVSM